jgi:hypothetical protein
MMRHVPLQLAAGLVLTASPALAQQHCCYDVGGGKGAFLSSSPCNRQGVSVLEWPLNRCGGAVYCYDAISKKGWRPSSGRFDCDERPWSSMITKDQYSSLPH